jgi:hypothetical protein
MSAGHDAALARTKMTERLIIARLGHRGDGVAETAEGPAYVPYTLPGEVVEVESFPGHPDRRHLLRVETPSAQRIAPICPHFGVCGRLPDPALGFFALSGMETRSSSARHCARRASMRRSGR